MRSVLTLEDYHRHYVSCFFETVFFSFSKKLTLVLNGEKYSFQGTLSGEMPSEPAVGARVVCPGKGPGRQVARWVEREGGVGADSQNTGLGNRLLVIPFR